MENLVREYKREITDDIEREVVAFLNTSGGELLIGVDDDGTFVGLANADGDALALSDRIKNNILPSCLGLFSIDIKQDGGKKFVSLLVAGGYEKPYYLKKYGMTPKGCFLRIGSQTSPMDQTKINSLYSRRILNTLHNVVSPRQNLTFRQLKIFYQEQGFNIGDFFLENLDFFTEDGKFNYAAYLMADNNATSIMVARFAGTDKVDIRQRKDYGGCCLVKTAYNVLDAINIYNETSVQIKYPSRVETSLVEPTALREAVLNAIIHNDYINGTDPIFEIYDDRIEVVSSGGLPQGLTEDEFFQGRSLPRNREIMRIFRDMNLGEHLGSGMQRIMRSYSKTDFSVSTNFVSAIFRYKSQAIKQLAQKNKAANTQKNVTIPEGDVTNHVTIPKADVTNHVTIPEADVTISEGNVTISEGNVTISEGNVTIPGGDVTNHVTIPEADVTIPKDNVTIPEGDVTNHVTIPEADVTIPKGNVTISEGNVTIPDQDLEKHILSLIKNDDTATIENIAKSINRTQRTVKRIIQDLKSQGKLIRIGNNRTGTWKLNDPTDQ